MLEMPAPRPTGINLENAVVYDTECWANYWSLTATGLHHDYWLRFELSYRRWELDGLYRWFQHLNTNNIQMLGFNNVYYDYGMIHPIWTNPGDVSNESLFACNNVLIPPAGEERPKFGNQIWPNERFAPQIDLRLLHHFDNKAKIQSLKGLEFNMRSANVHESAVPFGIALNDEQITQHVEVYERDDVVETKRFAHISMDMLKFRQTISEQLSGDVMNFNDTKIGKEMLTQRLGRELTHQRVNGRNEPRQTVRRTIPLRDVILPEIKFSHPEFARVHQWMLAQTLEPSDLEAEDARATTKGVFSGVNANINGFVFHYGTGGIHGSVSSQHFKHDDQWEIIDIDVAGFYPNFAIVNKLAPEHLGEKFVIEYAKVPVERKYWQNLKGKKCYEANAFKLAGNGSYGASNDIYSPLYDPKFTMSITINGQLLLSMLAEWLLALPSVQMIQANTDGITIKSLRSMRPLIEAECKRWEQLTRLELEFAEYSDMWIRDVNNYTAKVANSNTVKLKGAYWFPRKFPEDITNAQPSAWYKDLSSPVIQRAVEAFHLTGLDPAVFIWCHTDPFDFMLRAKVNRASNLYIGEKEVQRITRYYIAKSGGVLRKVSPPAAGNEPGQFKRANGVSVYDYIKVMSEIGPDVWDARIHTKNKSKNEDRSTTFHNGWLVAECNHAASFSFDNLNRDWYIAEARKLLIT